MPLKPVERRSASAAVFEQLATEVLDGGLEPGQALPPERSLTGLLEVNRQAIREALQRLAQAGLVEITHGGPTKVLDYRRSGGLDLLPRLLVDGDGFDPEVVRSVMEMRATIGPDVARLAAERAPTAIVEAVRSVVTDMKSENDIGSLARLDVELWDLLVDASDNIAYRLSFNGLRAVYEPILELVFPVLQDELRDLRSRELIADALERGDGAAAADAAGQLLAKGTTAMLKATAAMEGREG
jgi:GntR family transcriptional repressor for pyruvate dehydrogenase complex